MTGSKSPRWMRRLLLAAAVYDILWGTCVFFFPHAWFRLAGMPESAFPEVWQFVGASVASWGVGYAIASTNPLRHWPIVLVGFLGKLLGPLVFVRLVQTGRMPLSAGWAVIANDLIWWLPFALILSSAYRVHTEKLRSLSPEVLKFALRTKTDSGETLEQLSNSRPVLLIFLRHVGCTFCREAMADLGRQRRAIEESGYLPVLVHMGSKKAQEVFTRYRLGDLPRISDEHCHLYRGFGLRRGTLSKLFGPKVWLRGFQAGVLEGHGVGLLAGDGFQMPGVFLIYHGEVIRSYRHQSAADRPNYLRFATEETVV